MPNRSFHSFSQKTIEFLSDLKAHNTKSWFEDHKHAYTEYVLKPAQSLVSELSDFMLAIDPYLETSPAVAKPFPEYTATPDFRRTSPRFVPIYG